MKGAVLYRLGMNSVKERMMRDNYGLSCNQIFRQGVHPESSKYVDARGEIRTNVGVEWIANKVSCADCNVKSDPSGSEDDQWTIRSFGQLEPCDDTDRIRQTGSDPCDCWLGRMQ